MIIFQTSDGAQLAYTPPRRGTRSAAPVNGVLTVDNATPSVHVQWRMSRAALVRMALRCLVAAVTRA